MYAVVKEGKTTRSKRATESAYAAAGEGPASDGSIDRGHNGVKEIGLVNVANARASITATNGIRVVDVRQRRPAAPEPDYNRQVCFTFARDQLIGGPNADTDHSRWPHDRANLDLFETFEKDFPHCLGAEAIKVARPIVDLKRHGAGKKEIQIGVTL